MPRQILIHAGFHKTGTSSVQATLAANAKHIWPSHALVLPGRINAVTRLATMQSVMRGPLTRDEFRSRLGGFLAELSLGERRGMILSAENLAGLMPGRHPGLGYDACPDLMADVEASVRRQWPDAEITFLFGQRHRSSWLRSLYWQNIRSSRLIDDFDSFAAGLDAVDIDYTIGQVRDAMRAARIKTWQLEDCNALPYGPASLLLGLADLRPGRLARMVSKPRANVSPNADIIAACLALNRSSATDAQISAQKEALFQGQRTVPKPDPMA